MGGSGEVGAEVVKGRTGRDATDRCGGVKWSLSYLKSNVSQGFVVVV